MKKVQTLTSLLLVTLLLVLCASAAFADAAALYTITIQGSTAGHIYEAYQVFKGVLAEETTGGVTTKRLSDIEWGTNIDGEQLLDNLTGTGFDGCTSAADVAEKLAESTALAEEFAEIAAAYLKGAAKESTPTPDTVGEYTIANLAAGYYLVKDRDADGLDAYTDYILQLVGNVTVAPKSDVPTIDKEVKDAAAGATYSDKTNAGIGDSVCFRLTGTVPDMVGYDAYAYQFNDTLSAGLTYNNDATVTYSYTIDGVTGTSTITAAATTLAFTKNNDSKITTGVIAFADLKAVLEAIQAEIGKDQSKRITDEAIVVEYTATLNEDAVVAPNDAANTNKATISYSNNPNKGGTGTTTEKEVSVYTYQFDLHKYNKANEEQETKGYLAGAEFSLYKGELTAAEVKTATPIVFARDAQSGIYKAVQSGGSATIVTTADGAVCIQGLDAGRYTLVETKAPAGFNTLENPEIFTITAGNDLATSTLNNSATSTLEIANSSGATLPSTGGMGTTIFTVVGLALTIGAAVVLVAKRKAGNK